MLRQSREIPVRDNFASELQRNIWCQKTEAARQRTEKSSGEKYQQKLHEREVDMNIGKNHYLIRLSIANRRKYHFQDLPGVVDYLMDLNEPQNISKRLKNANTSATSATRSKSFRDQLPPDFLFVPCDFWHDDESLITKEPELTDLKKTLNASLNAYASAKESTLLAKQRLEEAAFVKPCGDLDQLRSMQNYHLPTQKFMRRPYFSFGEKYKSAHQRMKETMARFNVCTTRSIAQGEDLEVLEEDDGSGWTLVKSQKGNGLVPTSYIEITSKKKGPSVPPKRGARRVRYLEALYDYNAEEDNELTIRAGDKIALVQEDTDGSGWTEGELNGKKGLFPTAYAKAV
ncbi:hypothetical protein E0198_002416 [Clavispora lusitaniae]|nr:hypothetical protein E0198_002416 [Clavispora lusitaniae]